jgi:hypothetical protein
MDLIEDTAGKPLVVHPLRVGRDVGKNISLGNVSQRRRQPPRRHSSPNILIGLLEGEDEKRPVKQKQSDDDRDPESPVPSIWGIHGGTCIALRAGCEKSKIAYKHGQPANWLTFSVAVI